jgi:hypothetical protein
VSWQEIDTVIEICRPSNAVRLHKLNAVDGTILQGSGRDLTRDDYRYVTSEFIPLWGRYSNVSRLQQCNFHNLVEAPR